MHADLFPDEGDFTPRPAWQVIEAARRQALTGELSLATSPTTRVYLRDGQVYFAERSTDGGLGVRLLVEGVITRQQMGKGALLVSGVEHLGRMFQRDTTIDRQSVELCVELMTDDVLVAAANEVIDHYVMVMYKRHPGGIDRWLPNRVELITRLVESPQQVEPGTVVTPAAPLPAGPPPAVEPPPVVAEPEPQPVADAVPTWQSVTSEQPVVDLLHDATPVSQTLPIASVEALDQLVDNGSGIHLAPSAVDAIMSTAIADEVAEAVRRALSAIDS